MSWLPGVLSIGGQLVDLASGVSNIVSQQQQISLMREQNQIQRDWVQKQESLIRSQMQQQYDLAINGPAKRLDSLVKSGYSALDARRLMGSGEYVQVGHMERPVLPQVVLSGARATQNMRAPPTPAAGKPRFTAGPPRSVKVVGPTSGESSA